MNQELQETLRRGLDELDLDAPRLLPRLKLYFSELLLWNPKLGLLEADETEIITKHFLDCAAGIGVLRSIADQIIQDRDIDREGDALRLVDLGSGAGLPGVIIAMILSEDINLEVHLVEKQQRRCGFLRNIVPILGLNDVVSIHQKNFEEIPGKFDIVTSRAFRNLNGEQLALQRALLVPGGRIAAYKGRAETIEAEMGPEFRAADLIPLKVPGLEDERHMVVL
jgi:16S rRNA (guanine527-N7)-methyltransferase